MTTKTATPTVPCIYTGCPNEYVPNTKHPGPHCVTCTETYLASYAPKKRGGVRTTKLGYNRGYR